VARTAAAYDALVRDLAEHRVQRTYQALVIGEVASATGLVDAPIGRSAHDPTRRAVRQDGRPAQTRYRVERRFREPADATAVHLELETGRTHQIRVHLQAIGHPVVGDTRYGGRVPPGVTLSRPFLHAVGLAFDHPATGRPVSFASPLADDLVAALGQFR
jgi:23S rRNA pseudouridine1911/1915/1917 synthase